MDVSFEQFRREHSRVHDPEVLQSSYELVPVEAAADADEDEPRRKKGKRRAVRRGATKGARKSEKARREEVKVAPKVYASPPSFELTVDVFNDQSFEFRTPSCRKAEMLWAVLGRNEAGADEREARRIIMDYQRGGLFTTTVSIEDGEYLFAFSADGCVRPDPRHATRIVLRPEGPFSPMRLARNSHPLRLENRGRADAHLFLETDARWVEAGETHIIGGDTAEVDLTILPHLLLPGHAEATLRAREREMEETKRGEEPYETQETGESEKSEVTRGAVRLSVTARAGGSIPVFEIWPRELGAIAQGRGAVEVSVSVGARGAGVLKGMVMLSNLDEVVDFRLDASGENYFTHTFRIDSARLPYREEGALRVTLVTDSYLANYRQQQVNVPYSLIYLKKSLPALSYGRVKKGMTRTLRLEVERSDGEEVDLEVSLPEGIGNRLEAYRVRSNVYSFRFDTREVELGERLSESVLLTDRLSGLSDRVKVLAEVGS